MHVQSKGMREQAMHVQSEGMREQAMHVQSKGMREQAMHVAGAKVCMPSSAVLGACTHVHVSQATTTRQLRTMAGEHSKRVARLLVDGPFGHV
eukprot:363767-Chlamydomonas_euryale.AAC.5